ncbi:MAG: hypothetical protein U0Z44_18485 [Kouleothrix sp.]
MQHRALHALQQIMAKEAGEPLAAREIGGDGWNSWDDPYRSRAVGVDDLSGSDRRYDNDQ